LAVEHVFAKVSVAPDGLKTRAVRTVRWLCWRHLHAPVAILAAFIVGAGSVGGIILFAVAGIMLVSSATAFCPTYTIVGISTYPHGVHRVGHHLRGGHA
jgi:hypothetical protein